MNEQLNFFIGQTIRKIIQTEDTLVFIFDDYVLQFYHYQECCECVYIESIDGDLDDLIGVELVQFEEICQHNEDSDEYEVWTFYKMATSKGYVTIRWNGSSNGYYSVNVDLSVQKKRKGE